jgi:putative sterol carrier protein
MPVDPGLQRFFGALVWRSRLFGGRLMAGDDVERRGFEGSVNLAFGEADDAVWHCRMTPRGVQFLAGPDEQPVGTVRLSADVFLQLLSGRTSMTGAQMTGRILVEGDGHCSMLLASLVGQTRLQAARRGLRGWLTRRFLRSVLRKSPTRYELLL